MQARNSLPKEVCEAMANAIVEGASLQEINLAACHIPKKGKIFFFLEENFLFRFLGLLSFCHMIKESRSLLKVHLDANVKKKIYLN